MVVSKITIGDPPNPTAEKISKQDNSFANQILILFSAPLLDENLLSIEKLSIQKEIEAIASVLKKMKIPVAVEIVVKVATSESLQDVFASRIKPLIIHFIGHGMRQEDDTALVLEDETGMTRPFSEADLQIALSNQKLAPCQLALINACHSQKLALAFEEVGVSHVIAIDAEDKILDEAARCFSRRLYQALFNGNEVGNSFLQARNAVKLDDKLKKKFNFQTFQQGVNFDEAFKYRLLPQTSHSQPLEIEPADTHRIIYPQWVNTNLPSDAPNFVGRKIEMHQIIKELVESDKRCIALHGMGGIGKTDLAKAIGRWFHERERFAHGVWLINLRNVISVSNLILLIKQTLELETFALKRELGDSHLLLILDDLDGLITHDYDELIDLLNSLLEYCSSLRLLLTARDSLVRDLLDCHQVEVGSMGASETKQIFKKYAPSEDKWGDNENLFQDFQRLVRFLDGYPLPIKLAASYMAETQSTIEDLCDDLDIKPLEILETYSPQERKERSLRITLESSFVMLSVEGQDIFPLLAFFPSGLSRDLAKAVWGRRGNRALLELFKFSMAEKSPTALDWRVNLPEPARTYAESKLQTGMGIEQIASQVLEYYFTEFGIRILKSFLASTDINTDKRGQQLLLQENTNLIRFLTWGFEHEKSSDGICRSARITATLSSYWRWIEPDTDPLTRLNLALVAAQRNHDTTGERLITEAISALSAKGEFRDIRALSEESNLTTFDFEVVTVNKKGKEIHREQKSAQHYFDPLDNDIALDMVEIPGGSFIMGAPEAELRSSEAERPQHQVNVSNFSIGRYPVTQAQWKVVADWEVVEKELDPDPSEFKVDYEGRDRWQRPVESISWSDAVEFCARLSNKTGKEYRLPTEAEWEYACRAGTNTSFHFGETISTELANYNGDYAYDEGAKEEYRRQTTPVEYFQVANNFGLSDMHGNVWEWCKDGCHENYQDAPNDSSVWLLKNSFAKVLRGGSWFSYPNFCRSAYRLDSYRDDRVHVIGFRVVCVALRTTK